MNREQNERELAATEAALAAYLASGGGNKAEIERHEARIEELKKEAKKND